MASTEMVAWCFDTLLSEIEDRPKPLPRFDVDAGAFPMFVTWKKADADGLRLRGCLGCFSPLPLADVAAYALKSAFEDSRFEPITAEEVPHLHCGVSLLTEFEQGDNALDWEVGKHGIIIEFTAGSQRHNATFLPEVATEFGWDHRATLKHLARKSGYRGKVDDRFLEAVALTRYQSSKAWLSYDQYKDACQG